MVLDELHKWRGWNGWLKGEFDRHREHLRFLVTGSARLDVYRRGAPLPARPRRPRGRLPGERAARKPWFAVEVKLSESRIDPALVHFRDRLAIPWSYQVVLEGTRDFVEKGVRVLPASRFLSALA